MAHVCFYGISLKWNYAADIGNFQTLLFLQRDMEMNPLWLIILSRLYEILHRKPCSLWAFIWKFRYSELNFCILKWCQVPLCASDETYFPGRCADIVCRGEVIGKLGVIHPEVLSNFDLTLPAAALELNFESLLWFIYFKEFVSCRYFCRDKWKYFVMIFEQEWIILHRSASFANNWSLIWHHWGGLGQGWMRVKHLCCISTCGGSGQCT